MSVPIPGKFISELEDAYNFYLLQVRITIERAFGILIHRFGILRRPMSMPICKLPAFVKCLMKLHNFYIDEGKRGSDRPLVSDERRIRRVAGTNQDGTSRAITIVNDGTPAALMGSGHPFRDVPRSERLWGSFVPREHPCEK